MDENDDLDKYNEFYKDVISELDKFGHIVQFKVKSANLCSAAIT